MKLNKLIPVLAIAALALALLPATAAAQIYVKNGGNVGLGDFETTNPNFRMHLKDGPQPVYHFEQVGGPAAKFNFKINALGNFSITRVGGTNRAEFQVMSGDTATAVDIGGNIRADAFLTPSSRALKENFQLLDSADVLAKVATLEISKWNYIDDPRKVERIGPMAEDFYATFGLGADSSLRLNDLTGVALAAIQGLNEEIRTKDQQIAELIHRIESLEQRLDSR